MILIILLAQLKNIMKQYYKIILFSSCFHIFIGVGAWAGGRDVFSGATAVTKVAPKFCGRPLNKCFLFLIYQKSSLNFRKCLNWHFDQAEVGYKHSESEISNFYVQKSKFYYGFQYNVQFSLI